MNSGVAPGFFSLILSLDVTGRGVFALSLRPANALFLFFAFFLEA